LFNRLGGYGVTGHH